LALIGACDMVSVIVRHTLVQLSTPDEMRGRVSAVNVVFIGASNEVGQFESGITAQWFGTVPAVVLGDWGPSRSWRCGRGGFRRCGGWMRWCVSRARGWARVGRIGVHGSTSSS
jgi:hypothetical protein